MKKYDQTIKIFKNKLYEREFILTQIISCNIVFCPWYISLNTSIYAKVVYFHTFSLVYFQNCHGVVGYYLIKFNTLINFNFNSSDSLGQSHLKMRLVRHTVLLKAPKFLIVSRTTFIVLIYYYLLSMYYYIFLYENF